MRWLRRLRWRWHCWRIERQFGVTADDWRELWVLWQLTRDHRVVNRQIEALAARRCPEKPWCYAYLMLQVPAMVFTRTKEDLHDE